MSNEYESDDFDMEVITGNDNPLESDDDHDPAVQAQSSIVKALQSAKPYTTMTRFKTIDKKTGQKVYKVAKQPSTQQRRLLKPFSKKK